MRSNDSRRASGSHDTPDQALPGWLFVLPWSLRHVGGVNEVVKALFVQFRNGRVFTPHLLVAAEESESDGSDALELVSPYHLALWSPVNHQRPFRALFSFVLLLPYRCWVMRRFINQHNITIVNTHFPGLNSLLFVALKKLKLFKGKIILSFHLSDVRGAQAAEGRERLWSVLLRCADHIVVVSADLAKEVLALDPTSAAKMTTIYNGVDLALFARGRDEPCAPFSVPNQSKIIVSIGAFIPRIGTRCTRSSFWSCFASGARRTTGTSWRRWPRS
jgi:glycosyltransferase involved in cell wall biosynthesis